VVVVVMGVGGSSGIGEGEGSGGDEDNSGDSDGRGPYNNQRKGPAEETRAVATVTATDTATATVTATDTATATVKATEKDENNAADDDGASRKATRTTSPGRTSRLETSLLAWHSVSVAMTVEKNRNNKKYTTQPPPVPPIV
jgi:hypothetical protein